MDSRGIPIVIPGSKYSSPRRNTKQTSLRNEIPSSPFIMPSIKNEQSLLEVYDSFADACFQSHYNHSVLNDDSRYNVLEFYKSEISPSDNTPIQPTLCSSPVHIEISTFESKVPELQASRNSTLKMQSSILSEETGPFDSHFLEYAPTMQVAPKVVNEMPKHVVPTDNDRPADAQLAGFSGIGCTLTQEYQEEHDISMFTIDNSLYTTCQTSSFSEVQQKDVQLLDNKGSVDKPDLPELGNNTQQTSYIAPMPKKRKTSSNTVIRRLTRNQKKLLDQNLPIITEIKPKRKPERKLEKAVIVQELRRGRSKTTAIVKQEDVKMVEQSVEAIAEKQTPIDNSAIEKGDKREKDTKNLKELKRERDKKEIDTIVKNFPGLARYYEFIERAGRGTFSKVYKARDLLVDKYMPMEQKDKLSSTLDGADANFVAVKLIFDISAPLRVANEIHFLTLLRSSPCITPLITAFRQESYTYVVLPYIEFDHFDNFFLDMTMSDVKAYISQLLIGLGCVHEHGIIHRDIKPGNFLYNNKTKVGYLADFGLAQKEMIYKREGSGLLPSSQYTQLKNEAGHYIYDRRQPFQGGRSGTKGFRAPEVMLKYLNQTTAIDIWAVGVLLLIILSGRYPFFNPDDDSEAIMELAHLFGMRNLREFIQHYGRSIQTNIPTIPEEEIDIEHLCREMNKENIDKWDNEEFLQAIDLLKNCLVLIHTKRYTATEALNHPFLKK